MGIGDDGIKSAVPGFLVVMVAAAAASVILPPLARIARPVTKASIRLYFDLADDVQEVVAPHQVRRGNHSGLFHNLLSGRSEELLAEELEVETEETRAETVLEGIAEIW